MMGHAVTDAIQAAHPNANVQTLGAWRHRLLHKQASVFQGPGQWTTIQGMLDMLVTSATKSHSWRSRSNSPPRIL